MRIPPFVTSLMLAAASCVTAASGETITLGTYNIEHFQGHFLAHELTQKLPKPVSDPVVKELLEAERRHDDEDNWEVAQVITDRYFDPDILVIQEGCSQENLEYFNKRWLHEAYAAAIVFPTNTGERQQNLGMLLKPGFKVLERKDQYYLEKDTVPNGRGDRLFARGPAFVLVQSPSGYTFWVGTTHQKSKRVDFDRDAEKELKAAHPTSTKAEVTALEKQEKANLSRDVAAWRLREAKRTHAIMKELQATKTGGGQVILLGDFNDDLGEDEAEKAAGGDAVDTVVGPAQDGFILATRALAEKGEISFGGYFRPTYRSFIDHIVTTPEVKSRIQEVKVFKYGLAPAASDHYPVYVRIKTEGATTQPGAGAK